MKTEIGRQIDSQIHLNRLGNMDDASLKGTYGMEGPMLLAGSTNYQICTVDQ